MNTLLCMLLSLLLSHPVMPDFLWPHGLQHGRPACPSPSPRVCPSSCPLHQWYHPTISSSDATFSCSQSFLASGFFPISQLFTSDDQNTVPQLQHQSSQWVFRVDFLSDWLVWSPCCPRDFHKSPQQHISKASILWHSAFFTVQLSQMYMSTGKTIALTLWTFVGRAIPLLFNTLSGFVIACLPRSSRLHILPT